MNIPQTSHGKSSGFTLLEILVAILIFAVLTTTVFGSYSLIFSNTGRIKQESAIIEMGKNCLDRITMDLQSLYVSMPPLYRLPSPNADPDPYRFAGSTGEFFDAELDTLRFTSLAHLPFDGTPPDTITRIVYYAAQTENNQFVLKRADNPYPFGTFEKKDAHPILCENLLSLSFTYHDGNGEIWETWDSESPDTRYATPKSIAVRLELGKTDRKHLFTTSLSLPLRRIENEKKIR